MIKILKYLKYILSALVVIIAFYYYVYLGIINPEGEKERVVIKEKYTLVKELEPVYDINTLLSNINSDFSKYLKNFFKKKIRGKTIFEVKIKDVKKINDLFGITALDPTIKHTLRLIILHGNLINHFEVLGNINNRKIYILGEFDNNYIYLNKVILDGMFSMINQGRMDLFVDDIKGYIDYSNLEKIKIDNLNLNIFDEKIGKSKTDLFVNIINGIEKVFLCNQTSCELTINEKLNNNIIKILLSNDLLSSTQKSLIKSISTETIKELNGTNIIFGKKGYTINSKNNTLLFDLFYDYTDNEIVYSNNINKEAYVKKDFNSIINDFKAKNKFFMSVMSNDEDIINLILKN